MTFDGETIKKMITKYVKTMTSSSSENDDENNNLAVKAEHYLVFIFTTASKDNHGF
jgi:hypothetical protein